MRHALRCFLFALLSLVAFPALVSAQDSAYLPNDRGVADDAVCGAPAHNMWDVGTIGVIGDHRRYLMNVKYSVGGEIKYLNTTSAGGALSSLLPAPEQNTQVWEFECDTGGTILERVLRDICIKAEDGGLIVTRSWAPGPAGAPAACAPPAGAPDDSVAVKDGSCTLTFAQTTFEGHPDVTVVMSGPPSGRCGLISVYENTTGPNTHGQDPLVNYVVQVPPATATVTAKVYHNQGGTNPRVCTASILSTDTYEQTADKMVTCFNSMGLGLNPIKRKKPVEVAENNDPAPPECRDGHDPVCLFVDDYVTFIPGLPGKQVTGISVSGGDNQSVRQEMNSRGVGVPTLSAWGMVIVVGLLLLSGYWLLQRRRRAVPVS